MSATLRCAALMPLLLGLFRPGPALGQGTPVVLRTGSGNPLNSMSVPYTNFAGGPVLTLDFGFGTQEQPQPGKFLDSFTISITGPDGTGYLVTVDASGVQWAPAVPGALPVDTSALQAQSSPFLASASGLASLSAYTLDYNLPSSWVNAPLTLNFDLFDNQDGLQSLGYYLVPSSIPEPSSAALLLAALGLKWLQRRR